MRMQLSETEIMRKTDAWYSLVTDGNERLYTLHVPCNYSCRPAHHSCSSIMQQFVQATQSLNPKPLRQTRKLPPTQVPHVRGAASV